MEITKEWEIKLVQEARRIVDHGFGKLDFQTTESRELKTKIVVWAGCSFVFFVKKVISLDKKRII